MITKKELVRAGQTHVAQSESLGKETGSALVKTGLGGLALGGVAWVLPIVTLPMMLVLAILLGVFLYAR